MPRSASQPTAEDTTYYLITLAGDSDTGSRTTGSSENRSQGLTGAAGCAAHPQNGGVFDIYHFCRHIHFFIVLWYVGHKDHRHV